MIARIYWMVVLLGFSALAHAQCFIPDAHHFSCQTKHQQQQLKAPVAPDSRSDTFDVTHYGIHLDIVDLSQKRIDGYCDVSITSKINNLRKVNLDLLALTVDSVAYNGTSTTFIQNGELLEVTVSPGLLVGDTVTLRIFYGGQPVKDASGWGGFYFQNGYAFNLGVGFAADPHNYGRVWFPCVDNFIDRATYDFYITTSSNNAAYCNGILVSSGVVPNNRYQYHWRLTESIPTYLASVAVADYSAIQYLYNGIDATYNVVLAANANDTADVRASFINLPGALAAFEQDYGPQPFSKVGFVMVPFSSGAMEHATNIAYPIYAANGTLGYESLMAHELSHHWWGDHITCETAEDMWINEGWASYSENIFFEHVYGKNEYRNKVRENHYDVLRTAHISDDGYRSVSGVPHDYTYGDHVYNKGADVVHTLRSYMGDQKFFDCVKALQDSFAFQNIHSMQMRDFLTNCGQKSMFNFFKNWVFNPGFPHFSVDSFTAVPVSGGYELELAIHQKLKQAPALYEGVPLEITMYSEDWEVMTQQVNMRGSCGLLQTVVPFEPVYIAVDMNEKISDATTDMYYIIDSSGTYDYKEALMTINVQQVTDSALVRVEHNWVAPDSMKTRIPGLHISRERYYKVDGIFPNGFTASATFPYNGGTTGNTGYLDTELLATGLEDSLVLLYRRHTWADWSVYPDYNIDVQGASNNRRGEVNINILVPGEYALAMYDQSRQDSVVPVINQPCKVLGIGATDVKGESGYAVYPNPAQDSFTLQPARPLTRPVELALLDMNGATIQQLTLQPGSESFTIPLNGVANGLYLVKLFDGETYLTKKILIVDQ